MNKLIDTCAYIGDQARSPALIIVTFTLAAFFDFSGWPLELFSHFRVQYIVLLAIAVVFLACLKHSRSNRTYLIVSILALLVNLGVVLAATVSFSPTSQISTNQTPQNTLSLLQFNVNSSSTNYPAFDQLIERTKPDVICVEEVSEGWSQHFEQLRTIYPYQSVRARPDNFGIAVLSKFKFTHESREAIGESGLPTILVDLEVPANESQPIGAAKRLQVIATHPMPPISPQATAMRDKQMLAIAKKIADSKKPTLLAGDFNATPWCYIFKDMVRESGLIDSRVNKGLEPSWPTMTPLLLIPIDHILMSPSITCSDRRIEEKSGSDHYPVAAKFIF